LSAQEAGVVVINSYDDVFAGGKPLDERTTPPWTLAPSTTGTEVFSVLSNFVQISIKTIKI
jgi:hypothetical protein